MLIELIPILFTSGSLSAGMLSMIQIFEGEARHAVLFVFLAALINGMGCYASHRLQRSNEFGKELRSLSELVTFGAAPSMILYVAAFNQINALGLVITALFPICGALRLARYNIVSSRNGRHSGLPIPVAGCALSALVLIGSQLNTWIMSLLVILLSSLMISTIRMPTWSRGKPLQESNEGITPH